MQRLDGPPPAMTARGNPQQQQQGSGGGDQEPPPASNHEELENTLADFVWELGARSLPVAKPWSLHEKLGSQEKLMENSLVGGLVLPAWCFLPDAMVQNAFKKCCIITSLDGSEDCGRRPATNGHLPRTVLLLPTNHYSIEPARILLEMQQQPQQQLAEEPPAEEAPPSVVVEEEEEEFPLAELARLDEMINRPRWVVPVLPKGELEVLLEAAIRLCRQGRDVQSEPCQRFFREGLTISFTKILTDEAVSGWKFEIHRCIMKNCERLVELCVTKLHQDWFPLLDLLAMVLNPHNKFHSYNGTRPSDSVPPGSQIPDDQGWVVDLINRFGNLGGFTILLERFRSGPPLSVAVIAALIRPFGLCHSLLTVPTVERYLMPIVSLVPAFLERLSDEELKREAKNESKNDALAAIVRALRSLAAMVPHQEETVRALEMFRLRMILSLEKPRRQKQDMNNTRLMVVFLCFMELI
ncbi:hypothetical protein HPB49_002871 [Dermacentor silvarum]|uniref:Uncharacterized protein n=1 Tax=Dermacentor silvarum TaxID=543639 RepID=A0ACB8DAG7_DERSI|nr:hypothetical protein HPB49_002871 [Dermacentor silvarum]